MKKIVEWKGKPGLFGEKDWQALNMNFVALYNNTRGFAPALLEQLEMVHHRPSRKETDVQRPGVQSD